MTKKSGISRTLKYTAIYAEKIFCFMLAMLLVYAAVYYFQGGIGEGDSKDKAFALTLYFGMTSLIMIFIIQVLNNTRYIPISISFGSRRKETFFGIQWINLILIVQSIAVFAASLILIPSELGEMKSIIIFFYILMLVILSGIGQFIGAISIKFGKLGGFLTAALIFMLIMAGIVALALAGSDDSTVVDIDVLIEEFSLVLKFFAILIAVIVYVFGTYINFRVLKTYEVRG